MRPHPFLLVALLVLASVPAFAIGPVDIEIGAQWWQNDLEVSDGDSSDEDSADAVGAHADFWFSRYGIRLASYSSDPDNDAGIDFQHAEFAVKLFALSERNYFAVGAGVQRISFDNDLGDDSSTGPRVSVDGRVGLVGMLYAYGTAAYATGMSDVSLGGDAAINDITVRQLEAGLALHPFPFLWIRGGYREIRLEGDAVSGGVNTGAVESTAKGPFLGAAVKF